MRVKYEAAVTDREVRDRGERMRVNGIMANLRVADIDAARTFYTDFLG